MPAMLGNGGGHIYRSVDRGENWTRVLDSEETNHPVMHFAVVPTIPTTVFASVHDWQERAYRVLKSVDGGETWERSDSGLPEDVLVNSIVADPTDPRVLFVGTNGRGVFRSVNGGVAWVPIAVR